MKRLSIDSLSLHLIIQLTMCCNEKCTTTYNIPTARFDRLLLTDKMVPCYNINRRTTNWNDFINIIYLRLILKCPIIYIMLNNSNDITRECVRVFTFILYNVSSSKHTALLPSIICRFAIRLITDKF